MGLPRQRADQKYAEALTPVYQVPKHRAVKGSSMANKKQVVARPRLPYCMRLASMKSLPYCTSQRASAGSEPL